MSNVTENADAGKLHRHGDTYGKAFDGLIHDLNISDGAVRLYTHMHWRYGMNHQLFEKQITMGDAMGVTEKVIKGRITELAAAGWVVVIARRNADGIKTSNFYHVFEHPDDAKAFRSGYQASKGEELLSIPAPVMRKSRKGVGGRNSHQKKEAIGTQVSMDVSAPSTGTQVSPSTGTQVSVIQTQVIQTQKEYSDASQSEVAPAPSPSEPSQHSDSNEMTVVPETQVVVVASETIAPTPSPVVEVPVVEKAKKGKAKPKPALKPRSEVEPEPVYEAVERHLFEIADATADDPYLWNAPIGYVTLWLLGRIAKFRKADLGQIRRPAEAKHVEQFVRWYHEKYKDAALPTEVVKFVKHWRAFGSEMNARQAAAKKVAEASIDTQALWAYERAIIEGVAS